MENFFLQIVIRLAVAFCFFLVAALVLMPLAGPIGGGLALIAGIFGFIIGPAVFDDKK